MVDPGDGSIRGGSHVLVDTRTRHEQATQEQLFVRLQSSDGLLDDLDKGARAIGNR